MGSIGLPVAAPVQQPADVRDRDKAQLLNVRRSMFPDCPTLLPTVPLLAAGCG
jgi:hypothetical protein